MIFLVMSTNKSSNFKCRKRSTSLSPLNRVSLPKLIDDKYVSENGNDKYVSEVLDEVDGLAREKHDTQL